MSHSVAELYVELDEIIEDLEGYKIDDTLHEPMEYTLAHDVVGVLCCFSPEEQQRLLREFSAAARRWAASYTAEAVMEDIESAIRIMENWIENPDEYDTYHAEVLAQMRKPVPLDCFDR